MNNNNPQLLQLLDMQVDTIHELMVGILGRVIRIEMYLGTINVPAFHPNANQRRGRRQPRQGLLNGHRQQMINIHGRDNSELNWNVFGLFLVRHGRENVFAPEIPNRIGFNGLPLLPLVGPGIPAVYGQLLLICVAVNLADEHNVRVKVSEGYPVDHFWIFPTPNRLFDEEICVVCMNGPAVMFLPCGHVCTCVGCARTIPHLPGGNVKCPMCREEGAFFKSVVVKFVANFDGNAQGGGQHDPGGGNEHGQGDGDEHGQGGGNGLMRGGNDAGLDVPDALDEPFGRRNGVERLDMVDGIVVDA